MSEKIVYFYKVELKKTKDHSIVPIEELKTILDEIFTKHQNNNAIVLTHKNDVTTEPIVMDIKDNKEDYLFVKLNRKRLNHGLQKRNYSDLSTDDILAPDEILNKGVETSTYCVYGYKHGILSIVSVKGAPPHTTLTRLFELYNKDYFLEFISVPNQDLISELIHGKAPTINKVMIEIPNPRAQILESIFNFSEADLIKSVQENTRCVTLEVKPSSHEALSHDPKTIERFIEALKRCKGEYNKVVLSAKCDASHRQMSYDLYEEYFKYPINIAETHREDGRIVEYDRKTIESKYKQNMMNIYDCYKSVILMVCDR